MMSAVAVTSKAYRGSMRVFAVAAGLFAIWGVALWLYNGLFFRFATFFGFGPTQIASTLAAFHVAYAVLAVPAVLFHRQLGYKLGVLAGLSVFALGAFVLYLAIIRQSSACLIGAVAVIGSCGVWLDTSLNPLAVDPANPKTAAKRLNLAHIFNGLGMYAAVAFAVWLRGTDYQLFHGVTVEATARPYIFVGLGAMVLAFLVEQIRLPDFASKGTTSASQNIPGLRSDIGTLASDRTFLLAAAALGAYCVVLTVLWTSNFQYHRHEVPGLDTQWFEQGAFLLLVGRLAGIVLMRRLDPLRLLQWCAGLCAVAIAVAAATGGTTGWMAMVVSSLFLSIIYPTVFGSVLGQNPTRMAAAAGLLAVAAGVSNALSSLMASLALDAFSVNPRLVVLAALPFAAVILIYALRAHAADKPACTAAVPVEA